MRLIFFVREVCFTCGHIPATVYQNFRPVFVIASRKRTGNAFFIFRINEAKTESVTLSCVLFGVVIEILPEFRRQYIFAVNHGFQQFAK
ncbi:Uncharacterised protein [Klebsiella pneumoniae]|nr:Uncharacterised protein [Klebsiella pneumoniae]